MEDTSDDGREYQPHGLFILSYAIEALKSSRITPRQVILLAYVDYCVNPYAAGNEDEEKLDHNISGQPAYFKTSTLQRILHANPKTVQRILESVELICTKLLEAEKVGRFVWKLKTQERNRGPGDLYVPPRVREAFEQGELTAMEMLVMSKIACFTLCGKQCYAGNKWLGDCFGISAERAQDIVRQLRRKGWLEVGFGTHDQIRPLLEELGQLTGYRRTGKRRSRVLVPASEELRKKGGRFIRTKEPRPKEDEPEEHDDRQEPEEDDDYQSIVEPEKQEEQISSKPRKGPIRDYDDIF